MTGRDISVVLLYLFVVVLGWQSAGCRSQSVCPRVDVDVSKLPPDVYVEAETAADAVHTIADEEEAIQRALERDPDVIALREAARVAWAQARTISGLRDPELGIAFGRGDRITERSWLVPRAELMPALAYPLRGVFVTSHPEDAALSTDPRVPRIIIPEGGEEAYLERLPRSYKATTSDSDLMQASIRFYPPNPFILRARGAFHRAQYAAAVCDLNFMEWTVRCRVRWLIARLRYLEEDVARLAEVVALRKKIADATDELAQRGQTAALDAVAASQQYLQAVENRDRFVAEQTALRRELERLVGGTVEWPAGYVAAPADSLADKLAGADWRRLIIEQRRDIGAAYWRAQAAEAALREAKMTRIPWFTRMEGSMTRATRKDRVAPAWELQRGTAELDPLYSISLDDTEESEWRIEAMVSIPFFSLGPGATRVQEAERKRAWAQLAATTRSALDGVRDAWESWRDAESRLRETRSLLRPRLDQAREVLDALREGPGVAECDQDKLRLAVLDMLRLAAAREFEVVEAQLRLEEALGGPLGDALESVRAGTVEAQADVRAPVRGGDMTRSGSVSDKPKRAKRPGTRSGKHSARKAKRAAKDSN